MSERSGGGELVVWTDYVCPYSYLAEASLRRLREEGATIVHRPFELRPAGVPPEAPDELRRGWETAVLPLAERLGLEIRFPVRIPRSRKAHEAAAHARGKDRFAEVHAALYHAYWVEGRDIGRIDVLVGIGESVGLDRTELKVVLDIDTHADAIAAETDAALAAGVTGVPAFSSRRGMLVGIQPLDLLRRLAGLVDDERE
jgi:predicted DsbA family dithiol-disulfide isomerase